METGNKQSVSSTNDGYAVIDLETTGLGRNESIVEIGVVLVDSLGNITDILETLVRPSVPMKSTEIHGITEDMVRHSPTIEELFPQILSVLDGRKLVAHNASFEARFLAKELAATGALIDTSNFVDTLKLSRKFLMLKNHKLATISEHYGIRIENPHHAISDAIATSMVLHKMMQEEHIPIESLSAIPFWGLAEVQAVDKKFWHPRR